MTSTINKQSDGTIELTITIPWADVKQAYDAAIEEHISAIELPGFRKGKAPRALAEEKLDKTHVYEDVLRTIIPKYYNEALTAQKIRPVVMPKIELKEATEGKDWVIRAITCEKPSVTLGEYKKAVAELNATKHKKIWTPGQGEEPKDAEKEQKASLDEILKALYSTITITLPAILLEQEVNRLLSDLIDQTKKLGLTVEQYLSSTGRTSETLKADYNEQAKHTLTLEFALEEIADKEGVLISDDDIDAVVKTAKTDEERKSLESQRYYLASVLRRQKTLDFLAAL